jgi:hypothetical protein
MDMDGDQTSVGGHKTHELLDAKLLNAYSWCEARSSGHREQDICVFAICALAACNKCMIMYISVIAMA